MEFPLYIESKKASMPYNMHIVNMHAHDFQEPKGDIIWTKHQANQEGTQKCDTPKGYSNYIKEPNQHMIDGRVPHTNSIRTNKHEEKQKTPMLKDLSHSRW